MNREELIKLLQSWLTTATDDNGNPIHVIMDVDIHEIATEIIKSSLPPAEGAEDIRQLLLGWEHYKRDHLRESEALDVEAILLSEYSQIAAQQQPTAEGAEEIDDETIAWAAEHQCGTPFSERWVGFVKGAKWHRSLHAQRIAEKMVSERNNTNYDMKPIEVTMDYAIKKLKKLIRVQRTCPQGHGKMKKTSFGPYWCLNCQKYYE